ncbi:MAG: Fur family transcriptional regulator [Bacillota bacterium]
MKEKLISEQMTILKEHGLRITPQRVNVLQTFMQLEVHPTIEDIHRELPNMSVATIYNNGHLFVKMKIFNELPYGNGLSRYELKESNHNHVICEVCGFIADYDFPGLIEVEDAAARLTKYKVKNHQMEIYGVAPTVKSSGRHWVLTLILNIILNGKRKRHDS